LVENRLFENRLFDNREETSPRLARLAESELCTEDVNVMTLLFEPALS